MNLFLALLGALICMMSYTGCTIREDYFIETYWLKRSDEIGALRFIYDSKDLGPSAAELEQLTLAGVSGVLTPSARISRGTATSKNQYKMIVVMAANVSAALQVELLVGGITVASYDGKNWSLKRDVGNKPTLLVRVIPNSSITEYEISVKGGVLGGTAVVW